MLIGNGRFYGGRSGILPVFVSAVGSIPTTRPVWSGIQHRLAFASDYLSFPSGTYESAISLPMKYGGAGMSLTSSASMSAEIVATANGSASSDGSSTHSFALTGLKNSPCSMSGSGVFSPSVVADGTVSLNVSIGAQPSAFDIAQAVWGMDNGIESGWTPRQVMRIMSAVLAGVVSGAEGTNPSFKAITGSKTRVTATTDSSGNRSSVTLDGD